MITHSIIKFRERVTVLNPHTPVNLTHNPQLFDHLARPGGLPITYTEEDLSKYIQNAPIKLGDFVTHRRVQDIYSEHSISYVTNVKTFVNRDQISTWTGGHPHIYQMAQVFSSAHHPWVRWETYTDYRLLTVAEYNQYIGTRIDYVRDHLRKQGIEPPPLKVEGC